MKDKLFGTVCKCKKGKIGIPFFKKLNKESGNYTYFGITLDNRAWQSKKPKIISDSIEDYYKGKRYD